MTAAKQTEDIIVVGGGVIGLSITWRLLSEGRSVTLLERHQVGRATSWAGAGILPPASLNHTSDPMDRLRGLSHQLFPKWAASLEIETGRAAGLRRCGGWYLADSPGEMAAMIGLTDYWSELNIQTEKVELHDLCAREPALTSWSKGSNALGAWWAPDEYQLRPPFYLKCLHDACNKKQAKIVEDCRVSEFRERDSKPQVNVSGRWIECRQLVLCGGAWLGEFTSRHGLSHSVIPVRGQILLLKTPRCLSSRIINVGHRYLACREDGHVLVGSCEEEVGFKEGTSDEMINDLHRFASSLIPELRHAQRVDRWSGFRPMTFDGFPMIGRIPNTQNSYVACGHFRSGLHLSTGTASIMTDLLQDREPKINIDAFRVGKQIT
ncbi:MAG: NAD(P)/FAD-dependent oxidoreductase [Rubripirellula sp.]